MQRSTWLLSLMFVAALSYWATASLPAARAEVAAQQAAPQQSDGVNPDIFSAQVDGREYLRNPDGTPRIVFTNCGAPVYITICGNKNLQNAATRFADVGPLEIRAGKDNGAQTDLIGSVLRNQPFFAIRVLVPVGTEKSPTNVFFWNGDRDQMASLNWRIIVEGAAL